MIEFNPDGMYAVECHASPNTDIKHIRKSLREHIYECVPVGYRRHVRKRKFKMGLNGYNRYYCYYSRRPVKWRSVITLG